MIMKMNNATVMEILNVLGKFDECEGKLSYAIHKTKRKMVTEFQDFETVRNKMIIKYGKEDENGNYSIKPGTEEYQKYMDEIIPISQDVVEIDVYQISQEDFDKSEYYNEKASTKDYDILEALFVKKDDSENNSKE